MKLVVVPSTLALLPEYSSIEDPIAHLRSTVVAAVDWLTEDGPARVGAGSPAAKRIGAHLLGDRQDAAVADRMLVVANGSATRTDKAPGHFDERSAAFDAAIGAALASGDPQALAAIDTEVAKELWAFPDAAVLAGLAGQVTRVGSAQVDYDDDPYGVQYWVVRWECES